MFGIAGAGALDEGHFPGFLAVGRPGDLPALGDLLELKRADNVGQRAAKVGQLGLVVRLPAGCHDERAYAKGLSV